RLTIHVGNQVLGDFASNVTGEMELDERTRDVALAESRESRLLLHAPVRSLPRLLDDVRRRFDSELPFARFDFFDRDLHRTPGREFGSAYHSALHLADRAG